MLTPFRLVVMTMLLTLCSAAMAQRAPNADSIHPDDIDWSPSWGPSSWTMDIDGAFAPTGTFAFTGSTFDLDPTGAYTLDLDTTATITMADNVSSAWRLRGDIGGAVDFIAADTTTGLETMTIGNDALPTLSFSADSGIYIFEDAGEDHQASITIADLAAARTLTVPDPGTNASFVMTQGAQTIAGATTFSSTAVFSGGQTRKVWFPATDVGSGITLDASNPPALAKVGSAPDSQFTALNFSAGGVGADDVCYIAWRVPGGYVVDSARLNVVWAPTQTEVSGDDLVIIGTTNAIGSGEVYDAAGTAWTPVTDEQTDGTAGKTYTTQVNIEVEDIAVDDLVMLKFAVDDSESEIDMGGAGGTATVLGFEIEFESTE